jgi:hypothetical protein
LVCEEELSNPRNDGHGPERVPSYGHQFGALHDRVVGDESPDTTFYSKISNKRKVDYICKALRLAPHAFHLDLPLPLEDWALSDDLSLINCGLYFADLRRQFYGRVIQENPSLENSPMFAMQGEAEYWNHEFNKILAQRQQGSLIADGRVLH